MQADIITIGDEILIGQIVDTNSAFIASEFNKTGIRIRQILSVSDKEESIRVALKESLEHVQLVIITGGLGPTNDDITKNTLAKFFNSKLIRNKEVEKDVENFFAHRGNSIIELNRSQADVPDNCHVINNLNGTAPGMLFQTSEGKVVVSLPGVPFEMIAMIQNGVIPWIKEHFEIPVILNKTFLTTGIAESVLAERLISFEKNLPSNFSLAYLPSPAIVKLRLGVQGDKLEFIRNEFESYSKQLENNLGENLFGYNDDTLESVVGVLLKNNNFTLSTAESCTGGNIANLITSVSGASEYFKGSIVAYSNEVKMNILGVNKDDLDKFGAVSEQVVTQMADRVKKLLNTDFAIATSGVAGPTGGSPEKPVGTVWIAIASPTNTSAIKINVGNHRGRNITRSSLAALNLLRLSILKIVEKTVEKV